MADAVDAPHAMPDSTVDRRAVPDAAAARHAAADAVIAESIRVFPGRLEIEVRIADPAKRKTNPQLIQRLCRSHPTLPLHACVNSKGNTFAAVMEETSVPHLLEHLIIDVQANSSASEDAEFVGTTDWICEQEGRALIRMSFTDDLDALRSFRDALAILNEAMVE